jgi:tetratricopeptide (TPR) repeat protein
MPLAIELAAARVKLLTPDQILARLEHHLDLLTAGSRDLPERQQTLRGAIAWSYELLDDGARRLVDRLSVFRGGFDLEMTERVCGPAGEVGGDVVERIGELVDQSLVRLDEGASEPRFAMLETIREYAAEMLAERGDAEAIADRHAAAMLEFAQLAAPELAGTSQRTWLERLEHEHDNMRAALDWAIARPDPALGARMCFALWRFWQQRGYLNEARTLFERVAAQGWTLDATDQARFDEAFGGIAYWQSDQSTASKRYDQALRIWREIGDKREIANALYNRAYADLIEVMEGRASQLPPGATSPLLDEALALYRELGDEGGEGNILWALGSLNYFTADPATAEGWYQRSLELHRSAGNRSMEAWSLHMLGLSIVAQRRFEEARAIVHRALQLFHQAGDVSGVTLVLDDLAIIANGLGDAERGGRLWGAARHLQDRTGTTLAEYVEQNSALFDVPTPKDALPPEELARLSAEGASMALDEVVAYALETPAAPSVGSHAEVST